MKIRGTRTSIRRKLQDETTDLGHGRVGNPAPFAASAAIADTSNRPLGSAKAD
jgi:hypothetical protein